MHRSRHDDARMVRARFVWFRAVAALALAFTLAGCISISPSSPDATSAGPSQPASDATPAPPAAATSDASTESLPTRSLQAANAESAAVELAALIVDAPDIASAYAATADALARAGVRIETTHHVFVEPVAPAARSSMWPRQVLAAAIEAQNRRFVDRISADDAGTMLVAMGWPLATDGGSAGDGWLAFLRAWLADAHANPDDATSFAPIFAAEMIRLGDGVDLAQARTAEVHFGLLELLVIAAGFERFDGSSATMSALAVVAPGNDFAAGRLAVEGPCDATLERYGIAPPQGPGSDAPEWMRSQAVSLVIDQTGGAASVVLTAIGHFQKIWRAAAFYFYSFVRVEASDKRLHKPNENEPFIHTTFTAKTGVDPEAFKGWVKDNGGPNGVREMNDDLRCAESLGIPRLTDVGDLAADVENWIVDWEVIEGMPEHAELAELCGTAPTSVCNRFDRYSTLGMKLRRTGPSIAEVDLFVRIKEEKESDHSPGAVEHEVPVSVRAKVDSSTMPSISPGDLTSPTGLIGPGLETIAGLIQSSFKPSSKATLIVTFHEAAGWVAKDAGGLAKWYGLKCDGLGGEWLLTGGWDMDPMHLFDPAGTNAPPHNSVVIDEDTLQGTYVHDETFKTELGPATATATAGASVALQADGSVIMTLAATTMTVVYPTNVPDPPYVTGERSNPVWEVHWMPVTAGECS